MLYVRKYGGTSLADREKILEAAALKPAAHCFETRDDVTEHRKMSQIGG